MLLGIKHPQDQVPQKVSAGNWRKHGELKVLSWASVSAQVKRTAKEARRQREEDEADTQGKVIMRSNTVQERVLRVTSDPSDLSDHFNPS